MKLNKSAKTMMLGIVRDPRLKILKPIRVGITPEKGEVLLWSRKLLTYGVGASLGDACEDFARGIAEEYWMLKKWAHVDRLGSGLIEQFRRYQEHIGERI